MLSSLREETEGKLQMLLSLRKNGLTSLFKEVRVFKGMRKRHPHELLWWDGGPNGPFSATACLVYTAFSCP